MVIKQMNNQEREIKREEKGEREKRERRREKRERGDRERVWEFGSLGILLKFNNTKS
jgi:hypothetical protein